MALIGAIDQGTSSSRFSVYDASFKLVAGSQVQLKQSFPNEGWVEMDPMEILDSVRQSMTEAISKLADNGSAPSSISAVGLTNQRETAVAWDRSTGKPLYNAIVWLDQRTSEIADRLISQTKNNSKDDLRSKCGLPIHGYFSALKLRWLIENVAAVRTAIADGRCLFGTVDSWLIWNLTGGTKGGLHVTDVTNASRTMLMNIRTLTWDTELCSFFGIEKELLPAIRSSSEIYGCISDEWPLPTVKIASCIGDQQSALVGHSCLSPGSAKNTYGTGCFLLCNTGEEIIHSKHGMLSTVAYQLGAGTKPIYALEGSVAIAGAIVRYLRDNLGLIDDVSKIEHLASGVPNSSGVYFVPALSGLFAPHWDSNARGLIIGLTQFSKVDHIARAALEAVAFQTADIIRAMQQDGASPLKVLKCDGGMSVNDLLMQIQADVLAVKVLRPKSVEATSKGAAMLALYALQNIPRSPQAGGAVSLGKEADSAGYDTFSPRMSAEDRTAILRDWERAVTRSKNWRNPKQDQQLAMDQGQMKKLLEMAQELENRANPKGFLKYAITLASGCAIGFALGRFLRH